MACHWLVMLFTVSFNCMAKMLLCVVVALVITIIMYGGCSHDIVMTMDGALDDSGDINYVGDGFHCHE